MRRWNRWCDVFFFVFGNTSSAAYLPRWRFVSSFSLRRLAKPRYISLVLAEAGKRLSLFGVTGRCLGALLFFYVGNDGQFGVVRCCFGRGMGTNG
jgi:hypothetical protein